MILTHAHADHVGIVEHVREDAQAPVYVHAEDAEMARTGKTHKRDGSMLPYLIYPALYRLFLVAGRAGAARTPTSRWSRRSTPSETSTSPAARASSRPPATRPDTSRSTSPSHGVLIAGDALCTYNPLTGARGPQLLPRAFAADAQQVLASLAALERIDAGVDALRPRRTLDGWPVRPRLLDAREVGVT